MSQTLVPADPMQAAIARVGKHWGLFLTYALLTLALGVMVLAWPKATLVVVAVLFAVQLLVGGIFNVVQAITADEASGGQRALLGILGAFSILVGLLALRSPLQTLAALTLIIGAWWLASGVVEIVTSFGKEVQHRAWRLFGGLVSVIAGVVVLVQPGMSLRALVWVLGVWLVVYGVILVGGAFVLRSAGKRAASASGS